PRWIPPKDLRGCDTSAPTETEPGTVMGTVGYMSPEQVRGATAEASSDVFSLGCVLYEMIAGRRAFARETAVHTMSAILEHEPPSLAASGKTVPPELDRVVARCLEKSPGERSQSARDLAVALRDLLSVREGVPAPAARPRIRRGAALALGAALLLGGVGFVYRLVRVSAPAQSLAILPFVNASGNPDVDYLGDGITESLINSLSQAPHLVVMSRNAVFRYKGRETDAQAAGRALGVQAVLTGRVVQRGDALSIDAELIDVRDNRRLWGEQYNRKLEDLLAVQDGISTEISGKLQLRLTGEERKRLTRRYTESADAYQLYLRGRYYWNKKTPDGFNRGIEYFRKAIETDAGYAPAYAGLAALYNNLANYNFAIVPPRDAWAEAKAAAEKALRIDGSLAAAHASLALVAYQFEWDWPTADREFRRALELDPGSASTYEPGPSSTLHWYSHYLMSVGRTEESFRTGRRALELDPVDLANNAHQGWYYLWTRQSDRALEPLQKTIEMDPTFVVAQWYLGMAHEQRGAFGDAVAQFQSCVRLTGRRPSMVALLGHAYAAADRKGEAEAILRELGAVSKEKYVAPYPVAAIHAALGRKDDAFAWLEKAYAGRDSWMAYLGIDPRLDGLRSDPRFADLLRRMNLAR
ncbi:MAG TPA: protein kinase, partial [Thermoanaerobaculia bacterium]|nr:protein kinase [Thermoanaerobaculia bacterium]